MKRYLLLLLITAMVACKKDTTKAPEPETIIGSWQAKAALITNYDANGKVISSQTTTPYVGTAYSLNFANTGTFQGSIFDGITSASPYTGTYTYTEATKMLNRIWTTSGNGVTFRYNVTKAVEFADAHTMALTDTIGNIVHNGNDPSGAAQIIKTIYTKDQ